MEKLKQSLLELIKQEDWAKLEKAVIELPRKKLLSVSKVVIYI